jgi:hypothetical protein
MNGLRSGSESSQGRDYVFLEERWPLDCSTGGNTSVGDGVQVRLETSERGLLPFEWTLSSLGIGVYGHVRQAISAQVLGHRPGDTESTPGRRKDLVSP